MKTLLLLLSLTLPASAATVTFKVIGIDCPTCVPPVIRALQSIDGVTNVRVDAKTKTATLEVPPKFDSRKIHAALSNAGFEAELPGEHAGAPPLPDEVRKSLDIVQYDGKTRIDEKKLIVSGKVTVIDFYGDWCVPCTILSARLERYMVAHPNIALRRVNVGHWDNAAAVQATREFRMGSLPYLRVYAPDGHFFRPVNGGMWDEVLAVLEGAAGNP